MRAELILTHKYLRKHLRQSVGAVLAVSLFAAAILTVLVLRDCADASTEKKRFDTFGYYGSISYDVDKTKLAAQKDALRIAGAGITTVTGTVDVPGLAENEIPYIGNMNDTAMKLKVIKLTQGRLPKISNEIAIETKTLRKIGLDAKLGETVKLQIKTSKGVQERTFTLVGILSDYLDMWNLLDASSLNAAGVSDPIKVPGILIAENSEPVQTANVLFPLSSKAENWNLGGHAVENINSVNTNPAEQREKSTAAILSVLLTVFLVIIIILGIYNIVEITLKDREQYIRLLRCIGLTGKQTFRMFLLQGIYLALSADVMSCLLGTVFSYGAIWISGAMGQPLVVAVSAMPYRISLIVCTVTVLVVFWKQTRSLVKKQPLEYNTTQPRIVKKPREFSWDLSVLWRGANSKAHSGQNRLTVVLIAGCIFILLFGAFYAEFGAKTVYSGAIDYNEGADYTLDLNGGTASPATLYTAYPRGEGVSPENLQKLRDTQGISVDFAAITMTSKQFLLLSKDEKNPYLLGLKAGYSFAVDQESKEVQKRVGYDPEDSLVQTNIVGMDTTEMEHLRTCVVSGQLNSNKFTSGEEVAVVGTGLKVGDNVTITGVVFSPETTIEQIKGKTQIHTIHAKVGAVLSLKKGNLRNPRLVPIHEGIIMSAQSMIGADPMARYDNIVISNTKSGNAKVTEMAKDMVYHVYSQSFNMRLTDMAHRRQEWRDMANQMMSTVYLFVSVFMLIVLSAFAVTTSLKVKSGLRSYILMRAIGLDQKQMRRLLYYDNIRTSVTGILLGAVLGFALCTLLALTNLHYSSIEIFLTVLLPLLFLGGTIIIGIGIATCIRPIKWILNQPIMSALNSIEY